MQVAQFPGGHSNLTFGPVAPTAHDMAREYRWLTAVAPVVPLAPRVYALCEDPGIIGSVFYVMERRRGLVVRDEEPLPLRNQPELRRRVSLALIDALADLHAIDLADAGLSHLGKPQGFVERAVMSMAWPVTIAALGFGLMFTNVGRRLRAEFF